MMSIDREQVNALTRQSKDLMDVWVQERKAMLAKQLAANTEVKKSWIESDSIEGRESQPEDNANAKERASVEAEPKPGRSKTVTP